MTQAKHVGNISRVMYDNWTDFVPSYHSYYDTYIKMKNERKKAARQRRIFSAVLVVAVILAFVLCPGLKGAGSEGVHTELYSVLPGDTLWSIAGKYKPDGVTMDEYLYTLRRANALSSSAINVGDTIIIPE